MHAVFTMPDYRRQGHVASTIHQSFICFRECRHAHVALNIFTENWPAHRVCESLSFRQVKETWMLGEE
ncbi:GNAT family N-acetyltransferase [Planococcus lenghuensis]|uniref:hypothetical protein n=1 Tax=Planococcus lenghuensis TaxID=2213202 RepID=UPI0012EBF637